MDDTEDAAAVNGSSPRASGPSGAGFEVSVAVHYALVLLGAGEARGLPGASVQSIEFQRGAFGHPFDDIVVRAQGVGGEQRVLDVQVKRSLTFTASDTAFAAVALQIVKSFSEPDALDRVFAVAIERTTTRIEEGVQEVLDLARSVPDADEFYRLATAPGRSNKAMRDFVKAFGDKLAECDASFCRNQVFDVLRRFHVLVFDFERPGSQAEQWDKERARHLQARATSGGGLYNALFRLLLNLDAAGGATDRALLITRLGDEGIGLESGVDLSRGRARLADLSRQALNDINATIGGVTLRRAKRVADIDERLLVGAADGGCVELSGEGGVGKSALLKSLAERRAADGPTLVFAPERTPPGGWSALRATLDVDSNLADFFAGLAADGGNVICVDGLDRFVDAGQQKTIIDILSSALNCKGLCVLVTARPGWSADDLGWLPDAVLVELDKRATVPVDQLSDEEAVELSEALPQMAPLMHPAHRAKELVRNLFRLRRLLGRTQADNVPASEAVMAADWWGRGDAQQNEPARLVRAKQVVLHRITASLLSGAPVVSTDPLDLEAVEALTKSQSLVFHDFGHVGFAHDILRDWAVACYIDEDLERLAILGLDRPMPLLNKRAFELLAQLCAEREGPTAFEALLDRVSGDGCHPSWSASAVMSLARADRGEDLLEKFTELMLKARGEIALTVIRRAKATESLPASILFQAAGNMEVPNGLYIPAGPVWDRIIVWTLLHFDDLKGAVLSAALELYSHRLILALFPADDPLAGLILDKVAGLLVAEIEHETTFRQRQPSGGAAFMTRRLARADDVRQSKEMLALHCRKYPTGAEAYLTALSKLSRPVRTGAHILTDGGGWASAAPKAFAAVVRAMVRELHANNRRQKYSTIDLYSQIERDGAAGSAKAEPFLDLLQGDGEEGLSLIHDLLDGYLGWALRPAAEDTEAAPVVLAGQARKVFHLTSFMYVRGQVSSTLVRDALCALEFWAHEQISGGRAIDEVIAEILGPGDVPGALLLPAIDLAMFHGWDGSRILQEVFSSPELLALDAARRGLDHVAMMHNDGLGAGAAAQYVGRTVRGRYSLHDMLDWYTFHRPKDEVAAVHTALVASQDRFSAWTSDEVHWTNPAYMVGYAALATDRANYDVVEVVGDDGQPAKTVELRLPAGQKQWLAKKRASIEGEQLPFNRALNVRLAANSETSPTKATLADIEVVWSETEHAQPHREVVVNPEPEDPWLARLAAAVLLLRQADPDALARRIHAIEQVIYSSLEVPSTQGVVLNSQVMYNAQAMAAAGLIWLIVRYERKADVLRMVEAAGRHPTSVLDACLGYQAVSQKLPADILLSLFRIGLESCTYWRRGDWGEPEKQERKRRDKVFKRRVNRLRAELDWYRSNSRYPDWPVLPTRRPTRRRRGMVLGVDVAPGVDQSDEAPRSDELFDPASAQHWLNLLALASSLAPGKCDGFLDGQVAWMLSCHAKTGGTNGSDPESAWSTGVFDLMARRARGWSNHDLAQRVVGPLQQYAAPSLYLAAAAFLVESDILYLRGDAADSAYLATIRRAIWGAVKSSSGWANHSWRSDDGMEFRLYGLMSAMFLRPRHGPMLASYARDATPEQLLPLLPILAEISLAAPKGPTLARLFTDVIRQIPPAIGTPQILPVIMIWVDSGAQADFWTGGNLGEDLAAYLDPTVLSVESALALTYLAETWISNGVVEAGNLLIRLQTRIDAE
jgi:hypothetical protein